MNLNNLDRQFFKVLSSLDLLANGNIEWSAKQVRNMSIQETRSLSFNCVLEVEKEGA